jgi:hypothetical protein
MPEPPKTPKRVTKKGRKSERRLELILDDIIDTMKEDYRSPYVSATDIAPSRMTASPSFTWDVTSGSVSSTKTFTGITSAGTPMGGKTVKIRINDYETVGDHVYDSSIGEYVVKLRIDPTVSPETLGLDPVAEKGKAVSALLKDLEIAFGEKDELVDVLKALYHHPDIRQNRLFLDYIEYLAENKIIDLTDPEWSTPQD